jgi:hypothetical protein
VSSIGRLPALNTLLPQRRDILALYPFSFLFDDAVGQQLCWSGCPFLVDAVEQLFLRSRDEILIRETSALRNDGSL